MTANSLHIGFFKGLNSSDTLLLEGNAVALEELRATLQPLAESKGDTLPLHSLSFVETHGGIEVTALRSNLDIGIRVLERGNALAWERNTIGWRDTLDKIETLIRCKTGHHYLDAEKDEVTVEISKGEYGGDWWAAQN